MAGLARPTSDIVVDLDDETITITLNSKFMKKCSSFKLDTEFEDEFQGQKTKAIATYENGKLTVKNTPEDTSVKPTTATREITGDGELLQTMCVDDVVCKRYWTKVT